MGEIKVSKEKFVEGFLTPISKVADNVAIVPDEQGVHAICSSQLGGGVVLYVEYICDCLKGVTENINIPDVRKFIRLFNCIKSDNITLSVNKNHLFYEDEDIKFKYFLLENGVMPKSPINTQKFKKLTFNTTFQFTSFKFSEILKGSSIVTDSEKIYFYTKNSKVFAELNDYERQNINNISYVITDAYEGTELSVPIPVSLEGLRLFAGLKSSHYNVKVNTQLKILLFECTENQDINVQFLVSGLVK